MEQIIKMSLREDAAGSGKFGASRGSRKHNGIDLTCVPGGYIISPVEGKFTKYGHCYGDDLQWRYVELTEGDGLRHRFFYCEKMPLWKLGMFIWAGDRLGVAQDITKRYPGQNMTPHIHYEILDKDGKYVNPAEWLSLEP